MHSVFSNTPLVHIEMAFLPNYVCTKHCMATYYGVIATKEVFTINLPLKNTYVWSILNIRYTILKIRSLAATWDIMQANMFLHGYTSSV